MRYWIIIPLFFLLISSVNAQDLFEVDQNVTLTVTVTRDGQIDSNLEVNISVEDPDNNLLVPLTTMTYNESSGKYFIFIHQNNISQLGEYQYTIEANNGTLSETVDDSFTVTETGRQFTESQGLVGIAILISAVALSFLFLFMGFKFKGEINPLAVFFVVIGMLMAIYSLQLGLNYSVNILEYQSLSDLQGTVYISVLWLLGGIGIISFILMTISFFREFGKINKIKSFGEGFDPISETYQ